MMRINILTLRSGIVITWSQADVDAGVQASLLQIYPILLSTLVSIKDHELATDDIAYALILCSSPLTMYLVLTSFCDLFGAKTHLYKRITLYRRVIRTFAMLVPFLWLALGITAVLLFRELKNDNMDGSPADVSPLVFLYIFSILSNVVVSSVLGSLLGLCLFRRWSQVVADTRARAKGEVGSLRGLCIFVKCAWCVFVNVVPQLRRLTLLNKVYYQPPPQMVHILIARIYRHQLGSHRRIARPFSALLLLLWSGGAISLYSLQ